MHCGEAQVNFSWPFQAGFSTVKLQFPALRGNITVALRIHQRSAVSSNFNQLPTDLLVKHQPSKMMCSEKAGQVPRGINTWNISIYLNIFQ
jgi:hypothetical protein